MERLSRIKHKHAEKTWEESRADTEANTSRISTMRKALRIAVTVFAYTPELLGSRSVDAHAVTGDANAAR